MPLAINFFLIQEKKISSVDFIVDVKVGWGLWKTYFYSGWVLAVPSVCLSYLFEEMILAMNTVMFPASPPTLFQKEHS